jgi:TPR repeat protein
MFNLKKKLCCTPLSLLLNLCVFLFMGFLSSPAFSSEFKQAVNDFDKSNYEAAYIRFSLLAKEGDTQAATYIGRMFRKGLWVNRDSKKAAEFLKLGVSAGDLMAHHRLGWMHANGEITGKRDYTAAVELWGPAAEGGLYKAQDDLGVMYWRGDGVQKNLAIAYAWFFIAKESNSKATAHGNIKGLVKEMTKEDLQIGKRLVDTYRKGYGLE